MSHVFVVDKMPGVDVDSVETKLRSDAFTRQLRTQEFFRDFDRLRTGFVTKNVFSRYV